MTQILNLNDPKRLSDETIAKMEEFKNLVSEAYNQVFGRPEKSHPDVMVSAVIGTKMGTAVLTIGCEACMVEVTMKYAQIAAISGILNRHRQDEGVSLDEIQMPDDAQKH